MAIFKFFAKNANFREKCGFLQKCQFLGIFRDKTSIFAKTLNGSLARNVIKLTPTKILFWVGSVL
jgi:hypothetical protein